MRSRRNGPKKVLLSEPLHRGCASHHRFEGQRYPNESGSGREVGFDTTIFQFCGQDHGRCIRGYLKSWAGDLVLYPSNNNAFSDLESGRVDAIVVGEVYGRYYMKTVRKRHLPCPE